MSSFGKVSSELYERMGAFQKVGSLTLMRSNADKDSIMAEYEFCKKMGYLDVRLLSAKEVRFLHF